MTAVLDHLAIGTPALLRPHSAVAGMKPDPTPFDAFVTRTVGTTLVAFAIANWSAPPRSGILLADLVMNAVLGGVDTAAITRGTIGAHNWRGVAVHGGLTAAFGWTFVRHRRARTGSTSFRTARRSTPITRIPSAPRARAT